jgi:hypothetical protein
VHAGWSNSRHMHALVKGPDRAKASLQHSTYMGAGTSTKVGSRGRCWARVIGLYTCIPFYNIHCSSDTEKSQQ